MINVQQRAQLVLAKERQILEQNPTGAVLVVSVNDDPDLIEHREGVMCYVRPKVAAKLIIGRTHRLATDEEAAIHAKESAARAEEYRRLEIERRVAAGLLPATALSAFAPQSAANQPKNKGKE